MVVVRLRDPPAQQDNIEDLGDIDTAVVVGPEDSLAQHDNSRETSTAAVVRARDPPAQQENIEDSGANDTGVVIKDDVTADS